MIHVSAVHLGSEAEDLVLEVIRSGQLAQGPKVQALEESFAARHGVGYAVAVSNGTTALVAALECLDLQPGDEVITSAFSFVATLNAILEAGATARFADIGPDFCLDPASVEHLIGPRTRAIMPVHLYGLPTDMPAIMAIADKHGLAVVEDAAQAHGARIGDRSVGSFGLGCFSMYATKNITSGEGGMVTTDDPGLADRLRLLRNQGMRARYQYEVPGHNYRMTDLQAAIAIPQLNRLDEISAQRRSNAMVLSEGLRDIGPVVLPEVPAGRTHVFHQYTIRVSPEASVTRDELAAQLAAAGVGSGIYYPKLMHDYDCYRGHPHVVVDPTPEADRACREVLSLPVHQHLSEGDLAQVVSSVRGVLS